MAKELDREKFGKVLERARVRFGLTYWGKSNNMRVGCQWNDKSMDLDRLTDEQVVLLWQLVNSAQEMLVKEQLKRDLLPEEVARVYRDSLSPDPSPRERGEEGAE